MAYIFHLMPPGVPRQDDEVEDAIIIQGPPRDNLAVRFSGHEDGVDSILRSDSASARVGGRPALDSLDALPSGEVYWADLPKKERVKWMVDEELAEDKREWAGIWRTFKNDPLQPVRDYFHQYVITGIGLFLEGYVIFSISNNGTLFKQAYPNCWSKFTTCNKTWTQTTTYLQLVGILLGQVFFGVMGDAVGRRAAMLTDMTIILVGVILLTANTASTYHNWVIFYAFAQFIFGFGIGGEYPMTSTRATEETEEDRVHAQRHRGRKVMLAYTMQGWGQFINLGVLILLLLIFNSSGKPPYSHAAAGATWRVSFALLIPVVLYVFYYRVFVMKELKQLANSKKENAVEGYDWVSARLLFTRFWHRLFGTAAIWFCNDWYFYGNGVFRSTFVGIIAGKNASVLENWLYSWINSGVQLVGYYFAALSVDFKPWGRRRMTVFSFFMVFAIFLCCAAGYQKLVMPNHIHWFQFLYYFSSFWGLFGSHTTSFLLAAESFPVAIRGTAHGISAATGKVASIAVTVWFNYVGSRVKFWITWPVALAGAFITWFFIADLTGLDLAEQERRWRFMRAGREEDYHGVAVHPRHLSRYERHVLKIHKFYDPELDLQQRREAKLEAKSVSLFGTADSKLRADGKAANGKYDGAALQEVPLDTV